VLISGTAYGQGGLEHFTPVDNTGDARYMQVNKALINGSMLVSGDEIAVFDGALCVGAVKVDTFYVHFSTILRVSLPSKTLPGAVPGHTMIYKIWDKDQDIEVVASATSYVAGSGVFGEFYTIVDTLVATTSTLTINTNPAGLSYSINGQSYTGETTIFTNVGSNYLLSAQDIVQGEMRYKFDSWRRDISVLSTNYDYIYTAGASSDTITVHFDRQYLLSVNSAHATTSGGGWYDVGAYATFAVNPTTVDDGGGSRYTFTGWQGSGGGSYTGSSISYTVQMNNPITEEAQWDTEYFLSTHENPDEGGDMTPAPPGAWYNSGTQVTMSAVAEDGYYFTNWTGDKQGDTNPTSIVMDGPKDVTANFGRNIQITIRTDPLGLYFIADGTTYQGTHTFTWVQGSTHTISVGSPQYSGDTTRYVFTAWSDGLSQTHVYTVPGSEATVIAYFKTQHKLTVESNHAQTFGNGWYDEGTNAIFSIDTTMVPGTLGTRYVFTGWTGFGPGSYTGDEKSYSVRMDNPIREVASWKTQYKLTVNSDHGITTGDGWYDAGSDATFTISPTIVDGGPNIRYIFEGWIGSGAGAYNGSNTSYTLTMNNPITENATWRTEYYLSTFENPSNGGDISPTPPGKWIASGTSETLSAFPAQGYTFLGWSGDKQGDANPTTVLMNGPKSVTANFGKQVIITLRTNPDGLAYSVDGVTYTEARTFVWIKDSLHTVSVETPQFMGQSTTTRYVYASWSDGGTRTHAYRVPGTDATLIANFDPQYLLTVNSSHGTVTGAGWYGQGASATFSVNPIMKMDGLYTQYNFLGWKGTGNGSYTGSSSSVMVTMNNPITEDALWDTLYYLTTIENPDEGGDMTPAPPGGWAKKDSVVILTAMPAADFRFLGWGGGVPPDTTSNPSAIVMNGPKNISANFGKDVQITVQTDPAGRLFWVDSELYSVRQTFTWLLGSTHQLSVDTIQNTDTGTRYRFTDWSDGQPWSHAYTVPNEKDTVTARFQLQYQLTVLSEFATPIGSGWYNVGTSATFSLDSTIVYREEGVRYEFIGWDIGGEGFLSTPNPTHTKIMNRPITVEAVWKKQYKLNVISDRGATTGDDWYDAGINATFTVGPKYISGGVGVRYDFANWTGDYTGTDTSHTVTMSSPFTVVAQWDTKYHLGTIRIQQDWGRIVFSQPGDSLPNFWDPVGPWFKKEDAITLTAEAEPGYQFQRWSGDVDGPITANPTTVTMNAPKALTAHFGKEAYITLQSNPTDLEYIVDGTPITTDSTFTWIVDSVYTLSVESPQYPHDSTRYVYTSWSDGGEQTHDYTVVDTLDTVTVNFRTEHYLDLISSQDTPHGEGWYTEGANATFYLEDTVIVTDGSRYDFDSWKGDGNGSYTGSVDSQTVVMNNPITERAFWSGFYLLTASVNDTNRGWIELVKKPKIEGDEADEHWYLQGESNIELIAHAKPGYAFTKWSGASTSLDSSIYLNMDAPKTVMANFGKIVQVVVETDPDSLAFSVDDSTYHERQNFTWVETLRHYLLVDEYVFSGIDSIRYQYDSWSDGGDRAHWYDVKDTTDTLTAHFNTQYYLDIVSGQGTPEGERYYDVDDTAGFNMEPLVVIGDDGKQYVFNHWESGDTLYTTNPDTAVVMSKPIMMTAVWDTSYFLNVKPGFANVPVVGNNYFPTNTWADYGFTDLEDTVQVVNDTSYHFTGWWIVEQSALVPSPVDSILMTQPFTLEARWDTLYQFIVDVIEDERGEVAINYDTTVDTVSDWVTHWIQGDTDVTIQPVDSADGYGFKHWIINDTKFKSRVITLTVDKPILIYAYFGKRVTVTTQTDPLGHTYYVRAPEAVQEDTLDDRATFTWLYTQAQVDTALFRIDEEDRVAFQQDSSTKYAFKKWKYYNETQEDTSISLNYAIPDYSDEVTAQFQTQHKLVVRSDYNSVFIHEDDTCTSIDACSLFVSADSIAQFGVVEDTVDLGETGIRYVFDYWESGDTTYSTNPMDTVSVRKPIDMDAVWKVQYYLTVTTDHDTSYGQGWYDAGSAAAFRIGSETEAGTVGIRYKFTGWSGSGQGAYTGPDSAQSVIMNNPITETALWDTLYLLSTGITPPGAGTITFETAPIEWDVMNVSGWYNHLTQVMLRADSTEGYYFAGWDVGAAHIPKETRTLTIVMDKSKYVTAKFGERVHITVMSSPEGLEFAVDDDILEQTTSFWWIQREDHFVSVEDTVFDGTPPNDTTIYVFTYWSDGGRSSHWYEVPGFTDTLTAYFQTQHRLTVNSIHDTPKGAGFYPAGVGARFWVEKRTISGGSGIQYVFTGWKGTGKGSYTGPDSARTVTMNNPITETAQWDTLYTLTTTVNPTGGGNILRIPNKTGYTPNETVRLIAIPPADTSYRFINWTGNYPGLPSTNDTLDIVMTKPYSIRANFDPIYHRLTTVVEPVNSGEIVKQISASRTKLDSVLHNTNVTLIAKAFSKYTFVKWRGDGTDISWNDTLQFAIRSDTTITAVFDTLDVEPPYVFQLYPPHNARNVPINPIIEFKVQDEIFGVNLTGLTVVVEGQTIIQAGVDKTYGRVKIMAITRGYYVVYDPAVHFLANSTIDIKIYCKDLAYQPNLAEYNFSFVTGTGQVNYTLRRIVSSSNGGSLQDPSSAKIDVEPRAFEYDTTEIAMGELDSPPALPEGVQNVGPVYYFGPNGMTFRSPVTIGLPISDSGLQGAGVLESTESLNNLSVYCYTTQQARWIQKTPTMREGMTINFDADTLGYCVIVRRSQFGADTFSGLAQVYNYPNPFNPDQNATVIRYRLSQDAKISIRIYDVSGILVTTLVNGEEKTRMTNYHCFWDGRNDRGELVANNVYFCVIESSAGERTIRKIAVLR